MGGNFTNSMNDFRSVISNIRSFLSSIVDMVMGVFLNLVIEFQKIIIKIRDMMGKFIGIFVVMLYLMQDCVDTVNSAWNGKPGQTVRQIGNFSCFHPDTILKTRSGKLYSIKNIPVNETLENGSKIQAVMVLNRGVDDIYYRFSGGVNGNQIYVTGMHLIWNNEKNCFCNVKDHPDAKIERKIEGEIVYSLITDDHRIQIGKRCFYDWEDDNEREKMNKNLF
jgi:hypothetical protein